MSLRLTATYQNRPPRLLSSTAECGPTRRLAPTATGGCGGWRRGTGVTPPPGAATRSWSGRPSWWPGLPGTGPPTGPGAPAPRSPATTSTPGARCGEGAVGALPRGRGDLLQALRRPRHVRGRAAPGQPSALRPGARGRRVRIRRSAWLGLRRGASQNARPSRSAPRHQGAGRGVGDNRGSGPPWPLTGGERDVPVDLGHPLARSERYPQEPAFVLAPGLAS